MARCIIRTLVELIFMGGIGLEKMQKKFPLSLRNTSPIDHLDNIGLKEASTFHLSLFN